eukprot:Colp12_sorted_trinity150504_noHs@26696
MYTHMGRQQAPLMKISGVVEPSEFCARRYPAGYVDHNDALHAASQVCIESQISCGGDPGAPILVQIEGTWAQVGIVSHGLMGCSTAPDIGANVTYAREFIESIRSGSQYNPTCDIIPLAI